MQTNPRFGEKFGVAITMCFITLALTGALYLVVTFETVRTISSGTFGRSFLARNRFTGELVVFDCATTGRMGGCFARKP